MISYNYLLYCVILLLLHVSIAAISFKHLSWPQSVTDLMGNIACKTALLLISSRCHCYLFVDKANIVFITFSSDIFQSHFCLLPVGFGVNFLNLCHRGFSLWNMYEIGLFHELMKSDPTFSLKEKFIKRAY